jgi:hypothetical protein
VKIPSQHPVTQAANAQIKPTLALLRGLQLIAALMPFHAFWVVYLGSLVGYQVVWQSWKEVVIICLGLIVLASPLRKELWPLLRRPVNLAILAFAVIALVVSLANGRLSEASFWFGLKTDFEFLVLFVIAQLVIVKQAPERLTKVLLGATWVVVIFGCLQVLVLPNDFLANFGYGPTTIEPYRLVDPAVKAIRILSTLSGPNQLGSFLVLPICLAVHRFIRKRQWQDGLLAAMSSFVLFHSYSRSAWIAVVLALIVVVLCNMSRRLVVLTTTLVVASSLLFGQYAWRAIQERSNLQYYLLHGQIMSNQVRGSDHGRLDNLRIGIESVAKKPLGLGLGTAGPASFYDKQAVITENYYLQLAIETGLAGLLAFMFVTAFLALELWRRRQELTAIPLLAALVGISAINLFLHGWSDTATALTFWALAGTVVGGMYVKANKVS